MIIRKQSRKAAKISPILRSIVRMQSLVGPGGAEALGRD